MGFSTLFLTHFSHHFLMLTPVFCPQPPTLLTFSLPPPPSIPLIHQPLTPSLSAHLLPPPLLHTTSEFIPLLLVSITSLCQYLLFSSIIQNYHFATPAELS
jgi:hypothetical protein